MILESAKINNYKSIGTINNVLYIEKTITALIGKNESGKSNVLEALGLINLWQPLSSDYLKKLTHGQSAPPSISLKFSFSQKDKELFPFADGDTILIYTGSDVSIEGGLSSLISEDSILSSSISELQNMVTNNTLNLDNSQINNLRNNLAKLPTVSKKIYASIFPELRAARSIITASKEISKNIYLDFIDTVTNRLKSFYNIIPQIYYRSSDTTLKNSYSLDEIKKIFETNSKLSTSTDVFYNLMKAAGVDEPTLIGAFEATNDPAKYTFEKRVDAKIKALVQQFNNFYKQEPISIDFKISSNIAKFYIVTDDKYMSFSERSNGLKWYFSLFISVKAETSSNRPILYLLDEPGVYLHVKAQKKLLELFAHLCESGNQLIYTTHSPFMINGDNIFNIRPIEKDETGISNIWRSTVSHKLKQGSKMETLSPLIEALGMELKDNIGPQFGRLNIVVEGPTDYMYVTAMLRHFKVSENMMPNIIPSAGVDNVNRIVSILIGWGCDYKVILDYDIQGYNQYKVLTTNTILSDAQQVFFVNLKTAHSSTDVKKPHSETIESLVSQEDNKKLSNAYDDTNDTKMLAAKEFYDKILSGELIPTENTCDNFSRLFKALSISI